MQKREPRTKPEQFHKDFQPSKIAKYRNKPILLAANGLINGLMDAPLSSQQPILLARNTPPSQDDLAENIEVQFTPGIEAKASELNHNPVKIFNWVRNNIEFIPTYGSIQGADMCLQTEQCNDMDTASLLIALLRASNIPARYVYGTIELPVDKVMNWAGGFANPNAALEFIASGGTPVTGLVSGGQISTIRMEHVWVEAYVPYGNYRGSIRDNSI